MNAAAVSAPKITAVSHHDRFKELLVISGVVPVCEDRRVRISNVVDKRSAAVITSLDRDVPIGKYVRELPNRSSA